MCERVRDSVCKREKERDYLREAVLEALDERESLCERERECVRESVCNIARVLHLREHVGQTLVLHLREAVLEALDERGLVGRRGSLSS